MATATAPMRVQGSSWLRPKYLLFAFFGFMFVYVLGHNETFLINRADPVWHHYQPFKWYLLAHGLAGACALILGPMQFSERLRRKYTQLHHVVGYIYTGGVFIAGPLGFYIQFFQERSGGPRSFSVAAIVDASLWMTTTGIAMWFILNGKVQQHRQWMTRSFAVALTFLEVRVIGGVTGWDTLGTPAIETIVWCCVAAAIPLADIVLQLQENWRTRPAVSRAQVART